MIAKLILDHQARMDDSLRGFQEAINFATAMVDREVSFHLRRSLNSRDGSIVHDYGNSLVLMELDRTFVQAVKASGYQLTTAEYVGTFSAQLDEFSKMYDEVGLTLGLPKMPVYAPDGELLASRAAMSLSALDTGISDVVARIRRCAVLMFGEFPVETLVDHVSSAINRLTILNPLARDLQMRFFRSIGGTVYRNLEDQGVRLKYSYHGTTTDGTRDFCRELQGTKLTLAQINSLDNGQLPGSLENAGGHGCSHFWLMSEAA